MGNKKSSPKKADADSSPTKKQKVDDTSSPAAAAAKADDGTAAPAAAAATAAPAAAAAAKCGKRYALVIGISKYIYFPTLDNAVNDAKLVKTLLRSHGVEVFYGVNLNSFEMAALKGRFLAALQPGDDAIIFFAGHGIEYKKIQRLIARGLTFQEKTAHEIGTQGLAESSMDLQELIDSCDKKKTRVNVVLLDCCRELIRKDIHRDDYEKLDGKQTPLNPRAPLGTVIGFACDKFMTASDGGGDNGLYTSHLKDHINDNTDIVSALEVVGKEVFKASKGEQKPRIQSNLKAKIILFPSES